MNVVELKAKPSVRRWLRANEINIKVIEKCLNIILNQVRMKKKPDHTELQEIKSKGDSSGYYFGFNEVYITENLDQHGWGREKKLDTFISHFLHEFRHWMQDNVFGVAESKLNYTDEDCDKERRAYCYNKWEVDARRFERRYKKEFIEVYHILEKLSDKPDLS